MTDPTPGGKTFRDWCITAGTVDVLLPVSRVVALGGGMAYGGVRSGAQVLPRMAFPVVDVRRGVGVNHS